MLVANIISFIPAEDSELGTFATALKATLVEAFEGGTVRCFRDMPPSFEPEMVGVCPPVFLQ